MDWLIGIGLWGIALLSVPASARDNQPSSLNSHCFVDPASHTKWCRHDQDAEDVGPTHYSLLPRLQCEREMREAMRVMDKLLQIPLGEWGNSKALRETLGKPSLRQWEQALKECVK